MSMKQQLAQLSIMAAMLGGFEPNSNKNNLDVKDIDIKPKKDIIPKGCKRYYFNQHSSCRVEPDEYTIYSTIAFSIRIAKKKFKNWQQNQSILS